MYALARALGSSIVSQCPPGWDFTLMLYERGRRNARACYVNLSATELPDSLYVRMIFPE